MSPIGEMRAALSFARSDRTVSSVLLSKSTFGIGTGAILMLAIFGRQVFGAGDVGIGILYAARGIGALLGPFLARAIFGVTRRGLVAGITASLFVVAFGYSFLPLSPTIWIGAAFVLVAHLGGGAQWMLSTYGLQQASPDSIRGRLFGFDFGLVTLVVGISTLAAGELSQNLSPAAAVWTSMALMGAVGLGWVWFSRPLWYSARQKR
jgi:hypothetical protein